MTCSDDLLGKSDEIEAIGEKLMLDFKHKLDSMQVVRSTIDEANERAHEMVVKDSSRPWKLRERRSTTKWAVEDVVVVKNQVVGNKRHSHVKDVERLKIELERKEIEKDFLAMGMMKLPRRPKKRSRAVQKTLNTLYPGLSLTKTKVTLEKYAVHKAPAS